MGSVQGSQQSPKTPKALLTSVVETYDRIEHAEHAVQWELMAEISLETKVEVDSNPLTNVCTNGSDNLGKVNRLRKHNQRLLSDIEKIHRIN